MDGLVHGESTASRGVTFIQANEKSWCGIEGEILKHTNKEVMPRTFSRWSSLSLSSKRSACIWLFSYKRNATRQSTFFAKEWKNTLISEQRATFLSISWVYMAARSLCIVSSWTFSCMQGHGTEKSLLCSVSSMLKIFRPKLRLATRECSSFDASRTRLATDQNEHKV